jgi:hypothetical protein
MTTGSKKPRRMSKMGKMRILKTLAVMAELLSITAVPALAKENGPIVATGGIQARSSK